MPKAKPSETPDPYARVLERLRRARLAAGLSQEEMAFRLGLSGPGYGFWESGRSKFSLYDLLRAADVLGIDVVELLVDQPARGIVAEVRPAYVAKIDPELAQLVAEVAQLDADEIDLAKKHLRLALESAKLRATTRRIYEDDHRRK